ncbi:hypothetical protein [Nocardiopsis sp. CNT312]|uniref:hypothetical protein n=1 Tax=Nocardiopsis sp. CNT312 TaxID=1137268 RepID=UPI00048FAD99|nr:hypothetical protein [Nocardiopsis sp. CNT312]
MTPHDVVRMGAWITAGLDILLFVLGTWALWTYLTDPDPSWALLVIAAIAALMTVKSVLGYVFPSSEKGGRDV